MKPSTAVAKVLRAGALLVFPEANRAEPPSLWHALFPGETMRWDWDDAHADGRVVDLWHLRGLLAAREDVVYAKWFRGRVTLFAPDVFTALLAALRPGPDPRAGLPREALALLELLDESSPRSTKSLRREADLAGRELERAWNNATKALWSRLLIVGAGEVPDGSFPSLAVSSTRTAREDLWDAALALPRADAERTLTTRLGARSAFVAHYRRLTR